MRTKLYHTQRSLLFLLSFLLLGWSTLAQDRRVSGQVSSSGDGQGVPGASIVIKGTNVGTTTDGQGKYSIAVKDAGSILVISSVGFTKKEVTVGTQSTINVSLVEDVSSLDEVVVTGYGTQSKKDITGAVAVLDGKKLLNVPAANLGQAMQGKITGVVVGNDNSPGGGVSVRIRGFGTINDNSPLYVIDGVPTKGNLSTINTNDIESMQVLKDASAASIYGSRAGNGVVIITTKRGKGGKPKFSYEGYIGNQSPGKLLDLLNSDEYLNFFWEARTRATNETGLVDGRLPATVINPNIPFFGGQTATPSYPDFYALPVGRIMNGDSRANPDLYNYNNRYLITQVNKTGSGTNWLDEIFNPASIQNHQIGVSGASESSRYAIGMGYFDQQGIMQYTSFKRYSLRANTEFSVSKKIRIGENMQVAYGERVGQTNGNQSESNPVSFAYRMQPYIPVYDIKGYFAGTAGDPALSNSRNPIAELFRNKDNKGKEIRLFGNMYAEADILKGLTLKTSFGVDYTLFNQRIYRANDPESAEALGTNSLSANNSYDWTWTWYNTATYNTTIANRHKLNFIVGTESIRSYFESLVGGRTGFVSDDLANRYLNAGSREITNSNTAGEWSLASEFGKVNYIFDDKYLLDLTLRRDRSSRFAKDFRVATFPAASVGWVLSKEGFMQSLPAVSYLKLRYGWGQTGNQEIGNYNAFSTFGSAPENSFYNLTGSVSSPTQGYELTQFGNSTAKWETTTSSNIGLDARFLKDKLSVSLDVFNRTTSDMLFPVEVQFAQGVATAPFRNIGEMVNRGVELGINYDGRVGKDFGFNAGVVFSTYRNEVTRTNGNPATLYPGFTNLRLPTGTVSYTQQGRPISSFYGLTIDGIFQTDKEAAEYVPQFGGAYNKAGFFKFKDTNGDGKVDDNDIGFIGSPHPDFNLGINLGFTYKSFQLDLMGQGVFGNKIFNYVRYWTDFPTFAGNRSRDAFQNSWRPGKTDATLAIFGIKEAFSSRPSTYYLEDGTYFRLTNVQLTYNLPKNLLSKIGLGNAALYVQGQNLVTFTGYTGLDPEVNLRNYSTGSDRQLGVDEGVYPMSRSILVGAKIGF
jgi:TonB-dependent starch-binding outer membrane protein SusC